MACTGGMSCWKLSVSSLLTQQGNFGLSAQYGWPRSNCGRRADYGVRDYRIIARNATSLVSSCLLGLALLTPTGRLPTIMAA